MRLPPSAHLAIAHYDNLDDEKFLFKNEITVEQVLKFTHTNAKDIIAMGFDLTKTFIFSDFGYVG